eukprot:Selendium_serpulae@DN4294_c0_g1_i1.p1
MIHRIVIITSLLALSWALTANGDGQTVQPKGKFKAKRVHKPLFPVKAPIPKASKVAVPKPTVILTPHCPDEYEFVGKDCIAKHEVPEIHTCPSGTNEVHGQCHKRHEASMICPHGFHLKGKMCVSSEIAPLVNTCPAGSFQHGSQCVIKLEHAPHCADGTARMGDRCARFTPMVKDCPTGYTPRGDLCATQVFEEPDSVCPQGTFPEGNVCKVVTEVEEICPPGTVDVGDNCATYANKQKQCPKGYSMQGKDCVRRERAPKMSMCANGGNPEEDCIVRIPVPPSPYCKIGKICTSGQCAKAKRLQPRYTCPQGYDLEHGSKCVKVVTYDCTKTHQDIECEGAAVGHIGGKGTAPQGKYPSHIRHRMLNVDSKGKYQNIHYSKLAPIPKCQKKAPVAPKTCEKVHTAQAEAYCDQGTFKGTYCEIQEYFAPEYRCDAKSDAAGDCYVEERTPILYSCPAGYTKTGPEGCTRTIIEVPHFFCPPGTVEPNCATFRNKACPGGKCVNKFVEAPKLICPEGFHMVESQHHFQQHKKLGWKHGHQAVQTHQDHPKCTKTVYVDKVAGCPRGTVEVEGMRCASFVDILFQKSDKKVAMQKICPQGFANEGGKCVKLVQLAAEPECPHGMMPEGFSCIKIIPQVAACPHGATSEKGACYAISRVTPIMIQDACGYEVSQTNCRGHYSKVAPKTKVASVKTKSYKTKKFHGGPVQPVSHASKGY